MGRNVDRPENGENSPKIALQIWKAYAKIPSVKLTIGLKLKPTKGQPAALKETLERANEAANECSHIAWEHQSFGQSRLHKLAYSVIRERYGLSAQLAVRVIAKVADAYKLDKKAMRVFHKHGSIAFDDRILRYGDHYVSIRTLNGREKITFTCGERERKLLASRQGETDLVYRNGKWYLFATINVVEQSPYNPDDYLGVDLGINRIATDSAGQSFSETHEASHCAGKPFRQRIAVKSAKLQAPPIAANAAWVE